MTLTRLDLAALRELAEAGGAKAYRACAFSPNTGARLRKAKLVEVLRVPGVMGWCAFNVITEAGRAELVIADASADAGRAALAKGNPNEPR